MKIVYSTLNCPACVQLKAKFKAEGIEFKEVVIGKDISKEEFFDVFPEIRSVPFVTEIKD
jgi:glutaredoxin